MAQWLESGHLVSLDVRSPSPEQRHRLRRNVGWGGVFLNLLSTEKAQREKLLLRKDDRAHGRKMQTALSSTKSPEKVMNDELKAASFFCCFEYQR